MKIQLTFIFLMLCCVNAVAYCVCRDGRPEQVYQASIDYACQFGAHCDAIKPDGACFQPNNTKSLCDYAVNSYYEYKAIDGATCDFSGAAILVDDLPKSVANGCVFSAMVPIPPTVPADGLPIGSGSVRSSQIPGSLVRFTIVGLVLLMLG